MWESSNLLENNVHVKHGPERHFCSTIITSNTRLNMHETKFERSYVFPQRIKFKNQAIVGWKIARPFK
jgi:hypothetical protein